MKAQGIELRYEDPQANHFKFYRVLWVETVWVAQWGRIGAVGQFKVTIASNRQSAMTAAGRQEQEKVGKGYERTSRVIEFDIPQSLYARLSQRLNPSAQKAAAEEAALMFLDACRASGAMDPEDLEMIAAAQSATDEKAAKSEEKMKANLLKMAAKLKQPEPEPAVSSVAASSPGSMEERLAAALERAQQNRTETS